MDSSQLRKQIAELLAKRARLEKELLQFRYTLVKGSLHLRYMECSYSGCKCKRGQKHGPFYYMSSKPDGSSGRTLHRYIGKTIQTQLAKGLSRYKSFQDRIHQMHKLDQKLSTLWNTFRDSLLDNTLLYNKEEKKERTVKKGERDSRS